MLNIHKLCPVFCIHSIPAGELLLVQVNRNQNETPLQEPSNEAAWSGCRGAEDTEGHMSGRGLSGGSWIHSLSVERGRSRATRSYSRKTTKSACWPLCEVGCGGISFVSV